MFLNFCFWFGVLCLVFMFGLLLGFGSWACCLLIGLLEADFGFCGVFSSFTLRFGFWGLLCSWGCWVYLLRFC